MNEIMCRTAIVAACALPLLGLAGCADDGPRGGGGSSGPRPSVGESGGGSNSGERNSAGNRPYYPGSLENPGAPPGKGSARGAD